MRLIARGVLFKRDAHVADFLRDEFEDGLDFLVFVLCVFAELFDFFNDFRSVDEMLGVDFPEPLRDFLPATGGTDAKALHDTRKRRHVRFREHARNILHRPFVEDTAVFFFLFMRDRSGDFGLEGDAAQRMVRRSVDFDGVVHHGAGVFEQFRMAEEAGHAGVIDFRVFDVMKDVADFEA